MRWRGEDSLSKAMSGIASLIIALAGLALILGANTFDLKILKVNIDDAIANVGALLLIVGVLQWLYDAYVRERFFAEAREEIIGDGRVARSGICDFFPDSREVNFEEHFLASNNVTIGVNYSSKLIDNSIELLRKRTEQKKKTEIISVKQDSHSAKFLEADFNHSRIETGLQKIKSVCLEIDPKSKYIKQIQVNTILRYSFVMFDSRIWVIISTNGSGRRAVPGFFVRHDSPWFLHFLSDIEKLKGRAQ